MTKDVVLKVGDLVKHYGPFTAVDNINFSINKGEIVGLLGPNGAGKSTTIQMLLGLLTPTSGQIEYFGMDFNTKRQAILQRINYLSAFNTLQGKITVEQNLKVFADAYNVANPSKKIDELLEFFGVPQLKK